MTEQQKAQKELERRSQRAQQAETWYFSEEKPAYDRTERQFFQSMAGNLARKLKENEPCPVCGSREHPHPALYTEDTVTEEQFQKAKERQQNALQQMEEHKKSFTQQEERCKMLEQQCAAAAGALRTERNRRLRSGSASCGRFAGSDHPEQPAFERTERAAVGTAAEAAAAGKAAGRIAPVTGGL
ncbi:MAG: hypothetical protein ACLR1R_00245 [Ruminococcus callidus]